MFGAASLPVEPVQLQRKDLGFLASGFPRAGPRRVTLRTGTSPQQCSWYALEPWVAPRRQPGSPRPRKPPSALKTGIKASREKEKKQEEAQTFQGGQSCFKRIPFIKKVGDPLVVQWVDFAFQSAQGLWIRSLLGEQRPHKPSSQETENRSSVVTKSIKKRKGSMMTVYD